MARRRGGRPINGSARWWKIARRELRVVLAGVRRRSHKALDEIELEPFTPEEAQALVKRPAFELPASFRFLPAAAGAALVALACRRAAEARPPARAYLSGLVANLTAAGYCAQRDPDDYTYERLPVKAENTFSEAYDVLTSTASCAGPATSTPATPASFPVERGDLPAFGSGCGAPYPPPISRIDCRIHLFASDVHTLDSTPIVGPDSGYCAAAGFTDGRALCAVQYALLVYADGRDTACAQNGVCCSVDVP